MNGLESFSGHIPETILSNNKPLEKLLHILDGFLKIRAEEVDEYSRRFLYPLVSDINLRRRFVDEWDAEYLSTSSAWCLECLYVNYSIIYGKKGTTEGLIALLRCLIRMGAEPTITIDEFIHGKPLILFNDDKPMDWLPEDSDIANELYNTPVIWCPTLLDDTWQHTYAVVTITISGAGYTPTAEYIQFLKSVIVLYLPMVKDMVNINLNFI